MLVGIGEGGAQHAFFAQGNAGLVLGPVSATRPAKRLTLALRPELIADQAEVLAAQLRAVGMKIKLPGAEDISSWLANTLGAGDFEMTAFFHLPYEDPSLPLSFYAAPNQMGYEDEEVEAAFLAVAAETDQDAQIEATKEAQRILIRKWAPMLNFYSPITHGARWSYLKGTVDGRVSSGTFNSRAWLDK